MSDSENDPHGGENHGTDDGTGSEGDRAGGYVILGREGSANGSAPGSSAGGAGGGSGGSGGSGQDSDEDADPADALTSMVEQPAKVMRIGTMIKQLLEEVRSAPLDDASRARMREIHATSIRELEQGLSGDLRDELERLTLPFNGDEVPSDAELRVAQAQLVGWLEGLFHGIQTALMAQQMAAQAQLKQMRELPQGPGGGHPGHPGGQMPGPGQYL